MKKLLPLTGLLVVLSPIFCIGAPDEKEKPARHTEKAGKFSFVPPTDWAVKRMPGLEYKIIVGPVHDGFASNINVVVEPGKQSLDDYVKANLTVLKKILKKFKVVEQNEFKTASGLEGVCLITENEQRDRLLRQTFYFFSTEDNKYVITCSTLAEDGAKLDRTFEQTMKTFQFEE